MNGPIADKTTAVTAVQAILAALFERERDPVGRGQRVEVAMIDAYAEDPLIHSVASARWFTETLKAHAGCPEIAEALRVPVLFQVAGDDKMVSADATRAVFERTGSADKTWRVYDELYHEIWFEEARKPVLDMLTAWLADHLPGEAVADGAEV